MKYVKLIQLNIVSIILLLKEKYVKIGLSSKKNYLIFGSRVITVRL